MIRAQCAQCRQQITREGDRLRCVCASVSLTSVQRVLEALEALPDPWPILATLDVAVEALACDDPAP